MSSSTGIKTSRLVVEEYKNLDNVRSWLRLWILLAGIAAILATSVDAALLQRKLQIFTGGFLSLDHLKTSLDVGLFITTSLIADMGITIPLTAIVLWIASRVRRNATPLAFAVIVIVVTPFMIWNFVRYRLQDYLGQAFDVTLTFEIANRSVSEILAVASSHLAAPVLILLGGIVSLIAAIWLFKFMLVDWKQLPSPPRPGIVIVWSCLTFLIALVVTCLTWFSSEPLETALGRKFSGGLFSSIGETLTDLDRDGYGLLRRPLDPEPFNPNVYPYATEIPGNGIDENGAAGDLPADSGLSPRESTPVSQWSHKPNIIFFLLESFRADLLEANHKGKAITPVLNRLAKQGNSVPLVFCHNGYTAPSRYHLFSGSLFSLGGGKSLIDDFKENGYEVAYFSAQDVLFGGKQYDIGYSRVDVAYDAQVEPERRFTVFATPGSIGLPYQVIIERVKEYLDRRKSERPLFLYVNFQDTHFPYHHHHIQDIISSAALPRSKIGPKRVSELWATYANTAANVDRAIGSILEEAKRALKDPHPGIVVTSDHGESLYDDGFLGHGIVINDNQTAVPLVYVNLSINIEPPIGLIQLRGAIRKALGNIKREEVGTRSKTKGEHPVAAVFQFLGNLNRPRQIARRDLTGRIIYDFRTRRFQTSDGSWRKPGELSEIDAKAYRSLINEWERLVLAARDAKRKGRRGKP